MNFRPKMPTAPPPSTYICFRCGQKGHYIGNCPTLADPNFNRPKIRKTTGIPKKFLKPVESRPEEAATNVLPVAENVLISAEGNLVTLQTNEELWNYLSGLSRVQDMASEQAPEHFKCPMCLRVLTDPVYFACCPDVNYCDECKCLQRCSLFILLGIRNFLSRNESSHKASACRSCRRPVRVDDLRSNSKLASEIVEFFGQSSSAKRSKA